jgi:hypothetical protein
VTAGGRAGVLNDLPGPGVDRQSVKKKVAP